MLLVTGYLDTENDGISFYVHDKNHLTSKDHDYINAFSKLDIQFDIKSYDQDRPELQNVDFVLFFAPRKP